jgi:hypothetical protein
MKYIKDFDTKSPKQNFMNQNINDKSDYTETEDDSPYKKFLKLAKLVFSEKRRIKPKYNKKYN